MHDPKYTIPGEVWYSSIYIYILLSCKVFGIISLYIRILGKVRGNRDL